MVRINDGNSMTDKDAEALNKVEGLFGMMIESMYGEETINKAKKEFRERFDKPPKRYEVQVSEYKKERLYYFINGFLSKRDHLINHALSLAVEEKEDIASILVCVGELIECQLMLLYKELEEL